MAVLSVTSLLLTSILWPMIQAALTINVTPSPYDIGLTKSLKVECLFSRDTTSALTYLVSLSLSHSTGTENPEYEDLVTTNSFETQVYGNAEKETEVYGAINKNNTSYIRVIWKYPNASRAGEYKCDAFGLNSKRKPVTLSSTVEVTAVYLDSDRLVDELRRLTGIIKSQNNATEIKIREMEARIQALTNAVEQNQLVFNKFSVMTMAILRSSLFISSPQFNGRRYWMTNMQLYIINVTMAGNVCEYFGGYLAEIESAEENKFVVDHLLSKNLFDFVLISGTDEEQKGVWRYHYSKNVIPFLNWKIHEPNGVRSQNCLAYSNDGTLVDITCSLHNNVGFICEISQ